MKWKELKEFANSLDEKQLEQKVIMWREDEVINEILAFSLSEDHYYDPENPMEGCFPKSDVEELDGLKKIYDKGFPILWEIF